MGTASLALRVCLAFYTSKFFTLKSCCSRKKTLRRLTVVTHFPKETQHTKHAFFQHWAEPVHYASDGIGLHLQTLKLHLTCICRAAGHFCRSVGGSAGVWQLSKESVCYWEWARKRCWTWFWFPLFEAVWPKMFRKEGILIFASSFK